jgi:hypothetical protein
LEARWLSDHRWVAEIDGHVVATANGATPSSSNAETPPSDKDTDMTGTIIIGAGQSGLAAARHARPFSRQRKPLARCALRIHAHDVL